MRRSVENAEHVGKWYQYKVSYMSWNLRSGPAGLFAPRAGQNFRDEQRRRRSQYDRGTRLAEIEDAYYLDDQDHKADKSHCYLGGQYNNRFRGPSYAGFEVY